MGKHYLEEEVIRSYRWLGHRRYTELLAIHPQYRPGKNHFEHNRKHKLFPRLWHTNREHDVLTFIRKYARKRTVCFSLNERSRIFRNERGFARSARESEIEVSQNLFFDLDFKGKDDSGYWISEAEAFIQKSKSYFLDFGIQAPVKAYTGKGFHLLFPYPAILVKEVPDISNRHRAFAGNFRKAFRNKLSRCELDLDNTHDLRRMLKIYGTAKPHLGILSRFYGKKRLEDPNLREHLLNLEILEEETSTISTGSRSKILLEIAPELPSWFPELLKRDSLIQSLWNSEGKPVGSDTSESGYDYSLVRALMAQGQKNFDDLATILAKRPYGGVMKKGKDSTYIKRTIANALLK